MKCLILEEPGEIKLSERLIPTPAPDEILLKVSTCSLCRTDAKMWEQGHRDLTFPRIPGHEICGRSVESKRRFVVWPGKSCGSCQPCRSGAENLCLHMSIQGFHRDGGFAEFICVPEASLIPVPDDLPDELACLAEPLACTINALEQAKLKSAQEVLVYGAGPVGLLMVLAATSKGAYPFIAEKVPAKLSRNRLFLERVNARSLEMKPNGHFDVVINAAPSSETLNEGLSKLRPGGTFCLFSGITDADSVPIKVVNDIHYRQLKVVGAYGCTKKQMEAAVSLLRACKEDVMLLIDRLVTCEEVPDAFLSILSGEALKIVLAMN